MNGFKLDCGKAWKEPNCWSMVLRAAEHEIPACQESSKDNLSLDKVC